VQPVELGIERLDDVLLRLSMLERRAAPKDEEMTLDRLSVVELRQRIERIERRLQLNEG